MINYELAKKLKDAGFPKDYESYKNEYSGSYEHADSEIIDGVFDSIPIPTLSELIEACGDKFWKLILEDGEWLAYGERSTRYIRGSTPEAAVAMLWLELNKS